MKLKKDIDHEHGNKHITKQKLTVENFALRLAQTN